jgi:hypothetical protein
MLLTLAGPQKGLQAVGRKSFIMGLGLATSASC